MAVKKPNRYPGLKVNPYKGMQNNLHDKETGKKKRKKKATPGSVDKKKGLSEYQAKTQDKFMLVREGESEKQWLHRTRFRRLRTEEELANTVRGKKRQYIIQQRVKRQLKNKIISKTAVKDFNFLKYYVFIINWATVKYDVKQKDLEIGLHFYENIQFTRDEFVNKCRLCACRNPEAVFYRFKNLEYIYEMRSIQGNNGVARPLHVFKLGRKFTNVLTAIYDRIGFQEATEFKPAFLNTVPPELDKLIYEMAEENLDIMTGKKPPTYLPTIKIDSL